MPAFVSHYARAFADVISGLKLDGVAVDRQLADFVATWDGSKDLREVFENPAIATEQKIAILDKMSPQLGLFRESRNFLAVLIKNDRIVNLHEVVEAFRTELQERQGVRQAEITTARELDEQEKKTLLAGVGQLAGAKIQPRFKLDKSILGGAVVRIGSMVYDGSVKGRLERLKEALIAG